MSEEKSSEQGWLTIASLVTIATVALGVALIYARAVLIPFVLALIIGVVIGPVLDFQVNKLRIPKPVAAFGTLCIGLAILFMLFLFARSAVESVITALGRADAEKTKVSPIQDIGADGNKDNVSDVNEPGGKEGQIKAGQYSRNVTAFIEKSLGWLNKWGIDIDVSQISTVLQRNIPELLKNTFGRFINFVTSAFLVVIFVIFLVIGRDPTAKKPDVYASIETEVRRYLITKAVISIATGLAVWLILSLLNLQLAGVFGMLAFLLNFIPSIGSIIATVLPLPVAVAQYENPWMILPVLLLPGAVQIIIGNIIEPKLMGKRLNLHPITVLLALSFWGLLWGGVGMILAVPITAVLRIVLFQFETLKPVAMLLAGKLPDIKSSSTAA